MSSEETNDQNTQHEQEAQDNTQPDNVEKQPEEQTNGHIPCKYWSSGRCKFGDQCKFTHDMSMAPMSYNIHLQYGSGYPLYIPQDVVASEYMVPVDNGGVAQDTRFTRSTMMVTPCKFFYKGKCKFGLNCRFSHMQPYGYAYPFYGGYGSYYQPPNMFRTQEDIENEQNQNTDSQTDQASNNDIESLTENLKKALLEHNKGTSNNNSFNTVAAAIQDLTLSFVSLQQDDDQSKGIVSYIKTLMPSLSSEDLEQIQNICKRNKKNSSSERNSEDVSKNKKKKKANNKTTTTSPTQTKSKAAVQATPVAVERDISQYAPDSYAAALLKPRTIIN
ncbi:hypothetical protein AKO1_013293 [Acrasis kona]|uniref:C3H1-type domain-containing protein n=1 Tax=Acrasis kona TaxID=1008807 RepID=A0AAW2YY80_9EUKA